MTFREAARKRLNNMPECNFDVERNGEIIAKIQALPVKDQYYLHLISLSQKIEKGDIIINGLNERFTVIKIEILQKEIIRLHFQCSPKPEQL